MMKFAVLQLSSFQQAEDVVQEALAGAFEHLMMRAEINRLKFRDN